MGFRPTAETLPLLLALSDEVEHSGGENKLPLLNLKNYFEKGRGILNQNYFDWQYTEVSTGQMSCYLFGTIPVKCVAVAICLIVM